MIYRFAFCIIGLLCSAQVSAQTITGRWEAEEVSLEITSILKKGILEIKSPSTGLKPARDSFIAEFFSNGRCRINNESGTYRQQGNEVYTDINGKTEMYTVYQNGSRLQLWSVNMVASQSPSERTATAIMMVRQMGMQNSFEYIQPTDRVSSIRVGTYFRYAGQDRSMIRGQRQNSAYRSFNQPDCEVSAADLDRIRERVESATFDSEKPKIIKAALAGKRCFRTDQIQDLLSLFLLDSDKLPIAKYAYNFVTDRSNYDQITDAFDFETSKDELRSFIQARH